MPGTYRVQVKEATPSEEPKSALVICRVSADDRADSRLAAIFKLEQSSFSDDDIRQPSTSRRPDFQQQLRRFPDVPYEEHIPIRETEMDYIEARMREAFGSGVQVDIVRIEP